MLGICLGMQILLSTSEEFGLHKTLEFIPGKVKSLKAISKNSFIPNIGWHEVTKINKNKNNFGINQNKNYFYFAHSYYCDLDSKYILSDYLFNGDKLPAVINNGGNLWGTQFHPELSASAGLTLINKFLEL